MLHIVRAGTSFLTSPVRTAGRVYDAPAVWNSGLIVCGLGGTLGVRPLGGVDALLVQMLARAGVTTHGVRRGIIRHDPGREGPLGMPTVGKAQSCVCVIPRYSEEPLVTRTTDERFLGVPRNDKITGG